MEHAAASPPPPRILTIAGSDSSGGAGIQADLKTILALNCYGLSVITALTAQNSKGVLKEDGGGVLITLAEFIEKQMRQCWRDGPLDAVKIGMLGDETVVREVAKGIQQWRIERPDLPIILDPVMISTSGSLLLSPSSISSLIELLLPMCTILTPNLPEAREILRASRQLQPSASNIKSQAEKQASSLLDGNQDIEGEIPAKHTVQTLLECARQLCALGPAKVLLKGGHQPLSRQEVDDAMRSLGIQNSILLEQQLKQRDGCLSSGRGASGGSDSTEFEMALGNGRAEVWSNFPSSASSSSTTSRNVLSEPSILAIRTDDVPHSEVLGGGPFGLEKLESSESTDRRVVMDVLYEAPISSQSKGRFTLFIKPFIESDCTHGTGCTLSSATASLIARDNHRRSQGTEASTSSSITLQNEYQYRSSASRACELAISYVEAAIIRGQPSLIGGAGTLDHGCTLTSRGVLSRSFKTTSPSQYQDFELESNLDAHSAPLSSSLIFGSLPNWRRYTQHPFTYLILQEALSPRSNSTSKSNRATLPLPMTHFLIQDYHFLLSYSRLFSHLASTSHSFRLVSHFSKLALATAKETEVHIKLCRSIGISGEEIESTRVSEATIAYTRWAESSVREGGLIRSLVATLPCLLGYAEVGTRLSRIMRKEQEKREQLGDSNIMKEWIEEYSGKPFLEMTSNAIEMLEQLVCESPVSPKERVELQKIWDAATRLEISMWDEAMNLEIEPDSARGILDPPSTY